MSRITPLLFFLSFLLVQCDQNQRKESAFDINEALNTLENQNTPQDLEQLLLHKKVLEENEYFPDSLYAKNNHLIGLYYKKKGKLDSASVYFHKAIEYAKYPIETIRERDYFYHCWITYFYLERFGDAIAVSDKFKSLLDQENNPSFMAYAYYFDENTYKGSGDFELSLEFNEKRIKALEESGDSLDFASALISRVELKYFYFRDVDGAFKILDDLLKKEDQLTPDIKRQLYGNYGVFLYYKGDFKGAKTYYIKALQVKKELSEETTSDKKSLIATSYANLAEVCIELDEYTEAQAYLDSIRYLGYDNIERRLQKSALKYQFRLLARTNEDLSKATHYLDTIFKYQDKAYADKYNKELVALTKANDKEKVILAEKQETELKNLKLQTRFIITLAVVMILGVLGYLVYRQRRHRFERENLQMQQRLLRSQMNPHVTFNTLYAIQNLIKENEDKAVKYLVKFSRLLRLILENSMNNYVLLEKELESLRAYLDLQLLRFPGKFEYQIELDNVQEDDPFFIPPMLIQPIVENSIEHGFSGIDYLGELEIKLVLGKEYLNCIIEDNGKGFSDKKNSHKKSASMELISDFLRKSTKAEIQLFHKAEVGEKGIRVSYLIPYKTN